MIARVRARIAHQRQIGARVNPGLLSALARLDAEWTVADDAAALASSSTAATGAGDASGTPGRASANGKSDEEVIVISDDEPEVKTEPATDSGASAPPSADGGGVDAEIGRAMEAMLAAGADAETMRRAIANLRERAGRRG